MEMIPPDSAQSAVVRSKNVETDLVWRARGRLNQLTYSAIVVDSERSCKQTFLEPLDQVAR